MFWTQIRPEPHNNRHSLLHFDFFLSTSLHPVMQFQHSDTFDGVNLGGRRDLSTDQVQPLRISRNIRRDSRNGEYFDPVQHRDCGHQKVPLNRSDTRWETPPWMEGVMDADTGADGMIPVDEARPRALGQRDAGTQTVFGGEEKTFWVNRRLDLALIPLMWVSRRSDRDISGSPA